MWDELCLQSRVQKTCTDFNQPFSTCFFINKTKNLATILISPSFQQEKDSFLQINKIS